MHVPQLRACFSYGIASSHPTLQAAVESRIADDASNAVTTASSSGSSADAAQAGIMAKLNTAEIDAVRHDTRLPAGQITLVFEALVLAKLLNNSTTSSAGEGSKSVERGEETHSLGVESAQTGLTEMTPLVTAFRLMIKARVHKLLALSEGNPATVKPVLQVEYLQRLAELYAVLHKAGVAQVPEGLEESMRDATEEMEDALARAGGDGGEGGEEDIGSEDSA